MLSIKTLTVACVLATAASTDLASAWDPGFLDPGLISFYDDTDFRGQPFTFELYRSDACINIDCFSDRASSARWDNLPYYDDDGYKPFFVRFYTGKGCKGRYREWLTVDNHFPSNFELDGINNAISSFVLVEDGILVGLPVPACRAAEVEESGNATASEVVAVASPSLSSNSTVHERNAKGK